MKRFFGTVSGENIFFGAEEAQHMRQVLRMNVGDKIIGISNDLFNYFCTLEELSKSGARAKVDRKEFCPANPTKGITLFIAMPKREYFETIITKAVELGVSKIVPFISKFSVNHAFKRDRIIQIVLTACKQCERSILPEVEDVQTFEQMLVKQKDYDISLFANEHEGKNFDQNNLKNDEIRDKLNSTNKKFSLLELKNFNKIALIVGCEGGFSGYETEKIISTGAKSISLGKRILRCDTATMTMLAIVNVLSGN